MIITFILASLLPFCAFAQNNLTESSTSYFDPSAKINITYPYENMPMPNVPKTFVFGQVAVSTGIFYINGEKVEIYKTGSFLAYVPVKNSAFESVLFDGYSTHTYIRKVVLPQIKEEPKDKLFINLISPSKNMEIMPGENFIIYAKASPGLILLCEIEKEDFPLKETPSLSGNYYGVYTANETDAGKDLKLSFKFKKGIFSHNSKLNPSLYVRVLKNSYQIKTSTDSVILKNSPTGGYSMFLPKDVILKATGKIGGYYRIEAGGKELWIEDSKASFLSPYPKKTDAETGNLVFLSSQNTVTAKLAIWDKVPYSAYAFGNDFYLDLYYCDLRTNWVIYDSSDPYTVSAFFRQNPFDTASYKLSFSQEIKGYDIDYSTNSLILTFRFNPKYSGKYPKPLEGLKIVLDPGHSPKRNPPFDGSVSPSFYFEYEANLAIAKKIKEKLEILGASVYMTRSGEENIPLAQRPLLAKSFQGDIYISVHNNALPDGEDPFAKPRGFSVYYYHPNSLPLAREIHSAFVKNINLPDEGLRFGDYHVIRQTYMPAVLIENAYMIMPAHEEILKSEDGINKFAQATEEGILSYLKIPIQKKESFKKDGEKNAKNKRSGKNNQ